MQGRPVVGKRTLVIFALALLATTMGCWGNQERGGSAFPFLSDLGNPDKPGDHGIKPALETTVAIRVVDENGTPVSGFRYLVEEDPTYHTVPGVAATETIGTGIHRSHAPVLKSGVTADSSAGVAVPDDLRLFVSVLPSEPGWMMNGAEMQAGQNGVTITVHSSPLPTAQIAVYAFEDNQPLNAAPDLPAEPGLQGFSVIIHDFLGQQMFDAFGNMLGTSYMTNPDGSPVLDGDGNPIIDMMGDGYIETDANGEALIKNLAPGKYGVMIIPPNNTDWVQTSTIEGTPVVDAWVAHNQPPYFAEAGFFSWHVFTGFVHPTMLPAPAGTVGTITGQAVFVHDNRPPLQPGLNPGPSIPDAWVGLNNLSGADEMIYAQPCNDDGTFTIENVPPGNYQLVIFDYPLDAIIDFRTVTLPPEGGTIAMGKIAAFGWFGNMTGRVFHDANLNGYPDAGEAGVADAAVNLRFTDGSIYLSAVTNPAGEYCFHEVFPWFFWIISEIDFVRYKATGATVVVDDGGPVLPGAVNNPQPQPENGGLGWRTEIGEVLLESMVLMADMTHEIFWGKAPYAPGENGGISGVTYYAVTRAENDPRLAAFEPWEPGVPRVQVALYQDTDMDAAIDDLDNSGGPTRADVDNAPFGWAAGATIGTEDIDHNTNGTFDPGDAVQVVTTDSWDDSNPTGCVGDPQFVHGHTVRDCAETLRTYNQVRPGVFDGGYAFTSHFPGGMFLGGAEVDGLPSGYYIVEASPPPGYEIVKEEDKNVDFGETHVPAMGAMVALPQLGPPACVGDLHLVPNQLTLFGGVTTDNAGQMKPLCDVKRVLVKEGKNAAADFPLFTVVPKAALGWGMVFDDLTLEFDPTLPSYGSNMGVPWLPISIKDWTGREVTRVYTDEWGKYNVIIPSTYSINVPAPSGVAPNILNICLNDQGPIPDPANPGAMIPDPWYNPLYARPCVNLSFYPGKTTFLDTPILPIAAFAVNKTPLDCESPDGIPTILSVSNAGGGGPYLASTPGSIILTSRGTVSVHNPDYDPTNILSPAFINRDFGFGATTGSVTLNGVTLTIGSWTNGSITATVPGGAATGQLMVTRGDNGRTSEMGVTLHVQNPGISEVIQVAAGDSIQPAIDAAANNALILVAPGVYQENLVIYKPLKLQGYGAYSTIIQTRQMTPAEELAWAAKLQMLIDGGMIELIPFQKRFFQDQGAGILVAYATTTIGNPANPPSIDGLQITGAVRGGGINVNAFVENLQISNNRINSNEGNFGGGIRAGTPSVVNEADGSLVSSENPNLNIHHNLIAQNGAIDGGGGIALFNGSDDYSVTDNAICGNFSLLYGGGIAHFGLSQNGEISRNRIVSNQSFDEGGGVMIAGELVPAGAPAGTLTEGSGSITVNVNLVLGNMAGDDGGGIRTLMTNGQDVANNPSSPALWHRINILNNIIVNNDSWDAGGGLSLDDSAAVYIINSTIAHNDATSNGVDAFGPCVDNVPPGNWCAAGAVGGGLTNSVPQVGGIQARAHSAGLQAAFGAGFEQTFSNPTLEDNIIYQNRSFYWDAAYNGGLGGLRPDIAGAEAPVYWDLAVVGTPTSQVLTPKNGVLTGLTYSLPGGGSGSYDASNVTANPLFVDGSYFNSYLASSKGAALGNFVVVTFILPGSHGDYHIQAGSSALNIGGGIYLPSLTELLLDYDGQTRPDVVNDLVDAGADERP